MDFGVQGLGVGFWNQPLLDSKGPLYLGFLTKWCTLTCS